MLKLCFCRLSEWVSWCKKQKKSRDHTRERRSSFPSSVTRVLHGLLGELFMFQGIYIYMRYCSTDPKHTMIHCTSHHTYISVYNIYRYTYIYTYIIYICIHYILSYIISYMISYLCIYLYIYIYLCVRILYICIYVYVYKYSCYFSLGWPSNSLWLQPWNWWPHQMLKAPKSVWHLAQRDTSTRARYVHVVQGLVKRWILTGQLLYKCINSNFTELYDIDIQHQQ